MEDTVSVVKFKDGVIKIAHNSLIRLKESKKPFLPVSFEDLPDGPVEVKWQRSMCLGEFKSDGYFEATVLIIAG